jgi:hypothetical protein
VARIVEAEARLASGLVDASVRTAADAVALAHERGWETHAMDARALLCDALFIDRRDEDLAGALDELRRTAAAMPSPRYLEEAELLRVVFRASPLDVRALERIAAAQGTAPAAARRAAALLGLPGRLDTLDARVVEAARERMAPVTLRTVNRPADPLRPGWIVDLVRGTLATPEGRVADLTRRPLVRAILSVLVDGGGVATKVGLVESAWGQRSYHPLRDDKRLHVAMLRLRRLVERDPALPERIVTVADGYRLGDGEPCRALRSAPGHGR